MKKLSLTKFEFCCEFNSPQRLFSLFLIYNCLLNDRRMKKKVVAIKRGKNKLKIRFRYKLIMKIPHLRDWENFKLLHLLLLLLLEYEEKKNRLICKMTMLPLRNSEK